MSEFTPRIIKPSRRSEKMPNLKKSRCVSNYTQGVETSVFLDLNILSKIRKVQDKEVSLSNSGLKVFVKTLNSLPALHLSPGFAISEISDMYLKETMCAYEDFLATYCPGYIDAHNATHDYKNRSERPAGFAELEKPEKYLNAVAYLGILRVQIIERGNINDSFHKFDRYIDYMMSVADMVGAIETEVAKYVFSDASAIKDQRFRIFSSKIRKNFMKGGSESGRVLQRCLNSARDIMYYRGTADRSNEFLDGRLQDTWLYTADDGLYNLSKSIFFLPEVDGSDSKYLTVARFAEQKNSEYWNYCDSVMESNLHFRQLIREANGINYELEEKDLDKLLDCISSSEEELSEMIDA